MRTAAFVLSICQLLCACGSQEDCCAPPPTVTSVVMTPATATLVSLGQTVQLSASARDAGGNTIPGKTFTWSSSDEGIATVGSSGLVTAVENGAANITATTDNVTGSASIAVAQEVVAMEVSPSADTLGLGNTRQFSAVAEDANSRTVAVASFQWSSSNESVATVDVAGLVIAVGSGEATITAEASGVSAHGALTVEVLAMVSSGMHTCGVTAEGNAYCWGQNGNGKLGDGTTTDRHTPVLVSGGLRWSSVSAASEHTCGVTTDGSAHCWGWNPEGRIGDGTTTDRSAPVPVSGGLSFASVSTAYEHTCGVTTDGDAYCWGYNGDGWLGDGTTTDRSTPVPVSGGLSFSSVSTSNGEHTCGVTTNGDAYCWGYNGEGRLGDGTSTDRNTPVPVSGGLSFTVVSAGQSHTCGVTTDGNAYCWGWNGNGQLGDGTITDRSTPVLVSGGLSFALVSVGELHTCGVVTDGSTYCWGGNGNGQLGDGTTTDRHTPAPVSGGLSFASVSAGKHTCGVTTDRIAYCWGVNTEGQLGDGTTTERHTPVRVVW